MDITVINTTITAISSIITGFLGLYLGKKDTGTFTVKRIREKQLSDLYVPLEICLNFRESVNIVKDIEKIIVQNLELVPPEILNEFQKVKSDKTPNLYNLKRAVSSFYNWNKKHLNYPYEKSKIVSQYTPSSGIIGRIYGIVEKLSISLFGGSVGIFISQLTLAPEKRSSILTQISGIIAIVGGLVLWELIDQDKRN